MINLKILKSLVRPKIELRIDFHQPEHLHFDPYEPSYYEMSQEERDERNEIEKQREQLKSRNTEMIDNIIDEEIPRYLNMIGWNCSHKVETQNYYHNTTRIGKDIIVMI